MKFTVLLLSLLAGQAQQCQTWVANGVNQKQCFPFNAWVLDYHCDSGQGGRCKLGSKNRQDAVKLFDSRQLAIDWIEQNYRYAPGSLFHQGAYMECWFEYLYPESSDPDTKLMKSVDCDTKANLLKKYCQEYCIWY